MRLSLAGRGSDAASPDVGLFSAQTQRLRAGDRGAAANGRRVYTRVTSLSVIGLIYHSLSISFSWSVVKIIVNVNNNDTTYAASSPHAAVAATAVVAADFLYAAAKLGKLRLFGITYIFI